MKLRSHFVVTAAALLSTLPAVGQSTFTRITTGPIATEGGYSNRGCWVDYDDDGDLDLFVANGGYDWPLPAKANWLYRNDGSGSFTKITAGAVVEDVEQSVSAAWGDYDNDGHLDVFVTNLGAEEDASLYRNSLYRNQGDGTFAKVTNTPLDKDGGYHEAGSWADYDNDGHLDMLVVNWGGPRLLYHNRGDASFTRITEGPLVADVTAAHGALWSDYDGDGDPDLFVPNSELFPPVPWLNSLYRNEGGGTFTPITTGHPVAPESLYFSGTWGDYDNDGDLDLYACYGWSDSRNLLFQNHGDGTFSELTDGVVLSSKGAIAATWGDYDNDGFLDLFLAGGMLGNRLYHSNGDGTFRQIATGPGSDNAYPFAIGCDWGDYDNDGYLDLFVANGTMVENQRSRTNNFLYHNDGGTNRWLKVQLEGTASNRTAIGAKVRVLASLGGTAMWQLREVSVGCNWSGHNLLPHFGLRDAEKADVVRIEWPSGSVQELRDVPANQILRVTEPAKLEVTGLGAFRIRSWRGQSFTVQASADLAEWTALTSVTNVSGALAFTDPAAGQAAQRFYRVVQP